MDQQKTKQQPTVSEKTRTFLLWLRDRTVTVRHPLLSLSALWPEGWTFTSPSPAVEPQYTRHDYDLRELARGGYIHLGTDEGLPGFTLRLTPAAATILLMLEGGAHG